MCKGKTKGKPCKKKCIEGTLFCKFHTEQKESALKRVIEAQEIATYTAEHARILYEKYQKLISFDH